MKKQVLVFVLGLFIVGLISASVFALNQSRTNNLKSEKQLQMNEHVSNRFQIKQQFKESFSEMSYADWKQVSQEIVDSGKFSKMANRITEENFEKIKEIHQARLEGDFDKVKELASQLGFECNGEPNLRQAKRMIQNHRSKQTQQRLNQ
jgi:hypothetical protein